MLKYVKVQYNYILKVSSLLYLYEPYFCKTVKQVDSGGVVKSLSFKFTTSVKQVDSGGVVKSLSFKFTSACFKPTWFKAHCDHFLKIVLVFEV